MDKIVCLGKNYIDHAKELGDAIPEKPVIFLKPGSVLRTAKSGEVLETHLPLGRGSVHHETELVIRLKRGGYRMTESQALLALGEVSLGLDMTLRDVQSDLKKNGHPWTIAKVFPDSAIVGPFIDVTDFPRYLDEPFFLHINGKVRQKGQGSEMRLRPEACIAYASQFFPLVSGDLIFTGTPAGVGPIVRGDLAELQWGNIRYSIQWKSTDL